MCSTRARGLAELDGPLSKEKVRERSKKVESRMQNTNYCRCSRHIVVDIVLIC